MILDLIRDDITQLDVDAIVNAAKPSLLGGGGVDGAIHRAAGPELRQACAALPLVDGARCPPGEARATPGFRLPAAHVVHTVGPVWQGGEKGEAETLAAAYRNTLAQAAALGARTVAFPALSCGVYGYPLDKAASVAVRTLRMWRAPLPERAVLVAFSDDVEQALREALEAPHEVP